MLPIILTKIKKVLLIGAGRAVAIKLKTLSKYDYDITIVSNQFFDNLPYQFEAIQKNFYELEYQFFEKFDLIYIGIDLTDTTMVQKLSKTKLLNVLSNPNLSNFIHPCSRENEDIIVSISTKTKEPKKACRIAQEVLINYSNIF